MKPACRIAALKTVHASDRQYERMQQAINDVDIPSRDERESASHLATQFFDKSQCRGVDADVIWVILDLHQSAVEVEKDATMFEIVNWR
jgi:hypothetical protein